MSRRTPRETGEEATRTTLARGVIRAISRREEEMRGACGAAAELRPTTFAAPTMRRQTGQSSPVHWWWTSLPSAIAERNVPTARSAASASVATRRAAVRRTVWRMASCMGGDLPLRAEGTATVENGPERSMAKPCTVRTWWENSERRRSRLSRRPHSTHTSWPASSSPWFTRR